MHWTAPSEKDANNAPLGKRLWDAADPFRTNSSLKSPEYSAPVLGRMNLARHGGQVNSYYDDPHDATGRFSVDLLPVNT